MLLSLLTCGRQSQSDRVDSGFADKHAARATPVSFSAGSIAHSSRRARAGRPQITPCFDRINDDLPFLTERRRSQGLCCPTFSVYFSYSVRPLLNHPSESDMCVLTQIRASARGDCSRLRTSYLRPQYGRAMRRMLHRPPRMPYLSCVCRTIGLTDKADRPLILRSGAHRDHLN